jgi:hypothetical protein
MKEGRRLRDVVNQATETECLRDVMHEVNHLGMVAQSCAVLHLPI